MDERWGKIALAGLLHDIGKFGQRAGEETAKGKNHPAVGEKFVQQYVPALWRDALAPVEWHHGDPERKGQETFAVQVVMVADRLSAGEREAYQKEEDEKEAQKPRQMLSPFSRLAGETSSAWLPLAPLELRGDRLFPRESAQDQGELSRAYAALWARFREEVDALRKLHEGAPHLESYLLSLLDLLLRYTWCVPSAYYYDVPDVSLYDHSRTTAALAVCLYAAFQNQEKKIGELLDVLRRDEPAAWPAEPPVALLVEGDLSGIQDFLYGVKHPKGAASVLRARSFYLQVLTEAIARWILQELELPPTNLLYCGGGRFRLLLPPSAQDRLDEFRIKANRALLKAHHGELYLALAGVLLTPAHFAPVFRPGENQAPKDARGLRAAEDLLAQELAHQKDRRFLELPAEELAALFQPHGAEAKGLCQICGQPAEVEEDEEGIRWCATCQSFRNLGRMLRNAEFLRFTWIAPCALPGHPTWEDVLAFFGARVEVSAEPLAPVPDPALLYRLTDAPLPPRTPSEAVARKFLVNVVAVWGKDEPLPKDEARGEPKSKVEPGDIKHFGYLAHQSRGAPYLGVLRMDMDNLGWLFREGFIVPHGNGALDRGTFSRKHSLSTLLSVFFEGYVGELVRALAREEGQERVYAVYSGGDDLFLVGSWDAVLTLAKRIREDFRKFCGRADLGISGGFILVHEKFPLYQAALEAGERLEEAKRAGEKEAGARVPPPKDRFWFLGQVMSWKEFEEVAGWKERLTRAVAEDAAARRVLFVLQDMAEVYARERERRGPWGPWIWRTAYWLARQEELAKRAQRDPSTYQQLLAELGGASFGQNIARLAVSARWAELITRRRE